VGSSCGKNLPHLSAFPGRPVTDTGRAGANHGEQMEIPLLKMYGERNTGTNYLARLIGLNLEVEQIPGVVPDFIRNLQRILPGEELVRDIYFGITFSRNLGWKHSLVKAPEKLAEYRICAKGVSFVTLTKNPYSWLLSLYRNPYHQYWKSKPDFENFLGSPWRNVGRDNTPREFSSPVELWNRKNVSYMLLCSDFPTLNLRYEDLLENPQVTLEKIAERFSYQWKNGEFVNFNDSTKEKSKDFAFYRDYYLEENWKTELSPRSIEIINSLLDGQVMDYFGYSRLP